MTDDLVKRLRDLNDLHGIMFDDTTIEVADRIEALERRNKELEAALDVIASNNGLALSWMSTAPMPMERYKDNCYEMMNIARAALGEKKD